MTLEIREPMPDVGRLLILALVEVVGTAERGQLQSQRGVDVLEALRHLMTRALRIAPQIELRFKEDIPLINEIEVDVGAMWTEPTERLRRTLLGRGFGGLSFDRIPPVEVLDAYFSRVYGAAANNEAEREKLGQAVMELKRKGMRTLGPRAAGDDSTDVEELAHRRRFAAAAVIRLLGLHRQILAALENEEQAPKAAEWKAAFEDLLHVSSSRPTHLIHLIAAMKADRKLASSRGWDYASIHAASTAVLSICIGSVLGLGERELRDLASCAFFADMGFALLPEEEESQLDDEGRRALRTKARHAFAEHFGRSHVTSVFLRRLLVALEHHGPASDAHVYSRIIAVADAFDAMTSERPWRRARSPEDALQLLLADPARFDQRVVDALAAFLSSIATVLPDQSRTVR
jgi:HD-GYP domain-containing protein (c-di-GMP phosphodiesterase class II)